MTARQARPPGIRPVVERHSSAREPAHFVGRAPQQVEEFLAEVVEPLLAGASLQTADESEIRV